MDIEFFREYCLTKKGVTEEFPFDEKTLVFKVMGKIFALTDIDAVDFSINLKCEPEKAILLREQYKAVQPGLSYEQKTLEHNLRRKHFRQLAKTMDR
jgi:predicted DNA-binding protein (MmcQ/YjbR family)